MRTRTPTLRAAGSRYAALRSCSCRSRTMYSRTAGFGVNTIVLSPSLRPMFAMGPRNLELKAVYDQTRTMSSGSYDEVRTAAVVPIGTMAGVIALGIDPGTAVCGFGVVSFGSGTLRLGDAGCIRTPATDTDANRLRQLHGALRQLIGEHRPGRVGIERLFFQRNVQTAMAVGQARGVALLAASEAGIPIDEPTPNEVKQAVCGN